jgi:hypothetical protein
VGFYGAGVQTIQYLSADFQPTTFQSPSGITQLVKDLAPFDLTKAEKLQVVNLAPTQPVELYVVRVHSLSLDFQGALYRLPQNFWTKNSLGLI